MVAFRRPSTQYVRERNTDADALTAQDRVQGSVAELLAEEGCEPAEGGVTADPDRGRHS